MQEAGMLQYCEEQQSLSLEPQILIFLRESFSLGLYTVRP